MDAFSELAAFTRVVELRSFTGAARALGMTPSGVSRAVARLEARLRVSLLRRTTRSVTPTAEGLAYHERCRRILADVEAADLEVGRGGETPRGRLVVDAPQLLGQFLLGPALPAFLARWPEVSLDITFRDRIADPIAEGIDVALRLGELEDSDLLARRLGTFRTVVVASPRYLRRHRPPRTPAEIDAHACVGYLRNGAALPWRFREGRRAVHGRLRTDSGAALVHAALAGAGLVQVFDLWVRDEVARGALEYVLVDHEPAPRPISALYPRSRYAMPRVRAFVDFVAELVAPA